MKIKKLIIVLGCCIITLFSLVFVGCKRYETKASIYSQSILIELPAFAINIDSHNGYAPTMYLGYDTDYFVYYVRSGTGLQPYYYKGYNGSTSEYLHCVYGLTETNNETHNVYYDMALTGGCSINVFAYDNNTGLYTYDYIINNTTHVDINYSGNELEYLFYDINDNPIFSVYFRNLKRLVNPAVNENYSLSLVSTGILLDQQALLNNAYNNGYNDAYNVGYHNGYKVGVNDGFGATTPFDVFVDSVERFLNIELFGFFKISSLFYLSFGLIMLSIVIKVFLGG